MTRTVIIEPEAHEDLSRAFAWYEETYVVAFAHMKRRPDYWHARLPR